MDSQILEQVKKRAQKWTQLNIKSQLTQTPSGKDVDLTRANIIVQKKVQDA